MLFPLGSHNCNGKGSNNTHTHTYSIGIPTTHVYMHLYTHIIIIPYQVIAVFFIKSQNDLNESCYYETDTVSYCILIEELMKEELNFLMVSRILSNVQL